MVTYLPRSAWGARPRNGGGRALVPSRVDGTVFHWPGMQKPLRTQAAVASALRGWQDYHMDGRGWSDIAYQIAIDQAGRVWTLRGLTTQSGANGDEDVNERYGAILLVLAPGESPSMAMRNSARAVVADFRKRFPDAEFVGCHSDVRPDPTDCPGPLARAAIRRGEFTPGATTTPSTPTEGNMSAAELQELKEFTEERLKAYTTSANTYTRQVVALYAQEVIAADKASDDAVAARVIDALTPKAEALSVAALASVPAYEPKAEPA